MTWINKVLNQWQLELHMAETSALFLRVLNLAGFLLFVWMLPIADQVWGMDYFVIMDSSFEGVKGLAMLLKNDAFRAHYQWFLYPCLLLMAAAVFGFSNMVLRFITWFLFVNLHYANYEVSNGGWHLLHHLFFLSIFLIPVSNQESNQMAALKRLLHHLGFYFIWIQISILYLVAGTHKLLGNAWPDGEALLITLALDEFTLPWIQENLKQNTWFLKLGTWISLGYQISFPLLIWVKRVRPWLLSIGLIFHLSIAFIVGVTDFGLILVCVYAIFIPENLAHQINQTLSLKFFRRKIAGIKIMSGIGD